MFATATASSSRRSLVLTFLHGFRRLLRNGPSAIGRISSSAFVSTCLLLTPRRRCLGSTSQKDLLRPDLVFGHARGTTFALLRPRGVLRRLPLLLLLSF